MKVKIYDNTRSGLETFKIPMKKGTEIIGSDWDSVGARIICLEPEGNNDQLEDRTFVIVKDGESITNPKQFRYLSSRERGLECLFEKISQ